jgi:hypothetical protein
MNVLDLAAEPGGNGGSVFAVAAPAVGAGTSALWSSANGGATWARLPAPGPVLAVGVGPGGRVLAGTADAVLASRDGGVSWQRFPIRLTRWGARLSGQPGGAGVDAVLEAPGGWLYAGFGVGGLALSRDGGRTWQDIAMPIGDPSVNPGGLSLGPGGAVTMETNEGTFVFRPAAQG